MGALRQAIVIYLGALRQAIVIYLGALRQAIVICFLLLLYFIELIFSCCLSLNCVSKECAEAGGSHCLSTLELFH